VQRTLESKPASWSSWDELPPSKEVRYDTVISVPVAFCMADRVSVTQ
jgi:hypothetical protein